LPPFLFFGAIKMIVSAKNKTMLLGGVAFLALSASASAQGIINTIPQWDGVQFISSWGVPNTATYGQTITPTAGQTRLSSFTFQLNQTSGTAPQYQAFVYQWDTTNQRITGPALFGSSVFTAPGAGFSPVTINTGNVVLTPGQQYVLFLTTSTVGGQPNSSYRYGSVANTAYTGGQFVFQNNGTNFGQLSTTNWSTIAIDLAFQALVSATNVGEKPCPGAIGRLPARQLLSFAFDRSVRHQQDHHDDGPAGLRCREEGACRGARRQCHGVQGAAAGRLYAALGRLGCGLRRCQQHAGR